VYLHLPAPPFVAPGFATHSQLTPLAPLGYEASNIGSSLYLTLGPAALLQLRKRWRLSSRESAGQHGLNCKNSFAYVMTGALVTVTIAVVVTVVAVLETWVVVLTGVMVWHTGASVEVTVLVAPATVTCRLISKHGLRTRSMQSIIRGGLFVDLP
jgi:hypothetical protein